jgi:protoporphyrinogen oxidase
MEKKDWKIAIVGAGVSGLVAALELERQGYAPIIYEKSDRVGGRVKTDVVDGHQLDHGFQVLLDAYPMARKYLDYEALQLQRFYPGAHIYAKGNKKTMGDGLRKPSLLWATLTSGIATPSDAYKIGQLQSHLKKKDIAQIFGTEETTTLAYLQKKGFSPGIIAQFFRPFFTGIFLEPNLETSSRMFEFVFKMFASGYATLPKAGIGEIPKQLASRLKSTKLEFGKEIVACEDNLLFFGEGKKRFDYIILATEAAPLVSNMRNQGILWRTCNTLYFTMKRPADTRPLIGLIADDGALVNNIFVHTNLETAFQGEDALLSVTIVKAHGLTEYELIHRVKAELLEHCGLDGLTYLKTYAIPKALPALKGLQGTIFPTETRLTNSIFLAGDYLLNGSLNAAMLSGEQAAQGLVEVIEKGVIGPK